MKTVHDHILQTITLIRESFVGADVVYTQGSCIRFAFLLKHLYPEGKVLYDCDHAIFEYKGQCFDINGPVICNSHIPIEDYGELHLSSLMELKFNINTINK